MLADVLGGVSLTQLFLHFFIVLFSEGLFPWCMLISDVVSFEKGVDGAGRDGNPFAMAEGE